MSIGVNGSGLSSLHLSFNSSFKIDFSLSEFSDVELFSHDAIDDVADDQDESSVLSFTLYMKSSSIEDSSSSVSDSSSDDTSESSVVVHSMSKSWLAKRNVYGSACDVDANDADDVDAVDVDAVGTSLMIVANKL